jgi:succinate dehydrogenase / fumarate reductase cytochrome b subunit
VSLGHRISGLTLVLVLPLVAYLLQQSLAADADLVSWASALRSWPSRCVLLLLTWATVHHTAAGLRHLLFDAGYGRTRDSDVA